MLLIIQEQYHSIYIVWLSWPGSLPADGEHVKAGGASAAAELEHCWQGEQELEE